MAKKTYTFKESFFHYGKRFLRAVVPQIPALISVLINTSPVNTALWVLIGGCATALDKYLRDAHSEWYPL